MAKPMTKTEWLNWLEKAWDEAQKAAWAEKPKMRRTTRDEKIVNPGVYEVPVFDCPRCGHCCPEREWVGLTDEEIIKLWGSYFPRAMEFYQAIEAKLKEKNI